MIISFRPASSLEVIAVDIPHHPASIENDTQVADDEPSMWVEASSSDSILKPLSSTPSRSRQERLNNIEVDDDQPTRSSQIVSYLQLLLVFNWLIETKQRPNNYSPDSAQVGEHDADSSTTRGPFSALLSSVAKHRERRAKAVNKRKRKARRPISRASNTLTTALESASSSNGIGLGGRKMRSNWENMNMETASTRLIFFHACQLTLFDLVERFIFGDRQ